MKWLAILFGLFIIIIIILAGLGRLGLLLVINRIPFGDKLGHFMLYGILTLLIDLTCLRSLPNLSPGLLVLRIAVILALFIGIEEYSQKFLVKRTFDLLDLACSYLGVVFFSWMALRVKS